MEIMKETPWSRIRGQNSVDTELLEIVGNRKPDFRHDVNKRAKMTQPNSSPNSFMQQREKSGENTQSPRGKSPSGRMSRWPCKDYLKGTCANSFCEKWHPPVCLFYKSENGCRCGEKCSYVHRQVDEQPSERSKKNDDKSVAMLKKYDLHDRTRQPVVNRDESHDRSGQPVVKRDTRHELNHGPVGCRSSNTRQLGCVSQDMEAPKLTSILRKSSDMQKPIQRVKFTKAIARHTKIRDQKSNASSDIMIVSDIDLPSKPSSKYIITSHSLQPESSAQSSPTPDSILCTAHALLETCCHMKAKLLILTIAYPGAWEVLFHVELCNVLHTLA